MKRLTKLKNQFNGKLRVSLLILLALQLFVPKLNAQINLTASPTPPTNDCLNPEAIEVENNFQSYEADLSNLNSYYLSFNANKSTLYLDVLGDEEGDLPQSLKLYEEECSETPIEQTYMQTDSNGVQSIELNYHNLNIGQNYIVEIVQNSAASVGNLTLFIRNFDPLDPPLEPIVPECDNFVFNGSFELEDIPGTDVDLNTKIHLSTGYLLINNDYSNNNRADYFHTKGNSDYDIPTNVSGSGIYPVGSSIDEAYAGLFTVNTQQNIQIPEFREWICGQLDQGMVAGKQYEISYYVHLANKQWYHDPCIPPGIAFTSNPTTTISQINILQMVADIQPTKIISDTSKWHKITAYYTATGNEQYFTVANFLSNNESNNKSGRQVSYFFIDEIKVTESCCTALEIPDGWDVNDVLTSPNFGAVVSGSTLNDVNVKVNGTFTVNSNFSANNVTFIMAEDAKIKVTNGNFEVLGSEFRTCSNVMWKGIEVDGGALTIDGSKIKDAIKGINSLNGSAFTVSNTTFDANYYGIYVDAYNGYHTGTVEGSTFDCSYSLKDATVADNTLAGIYVNEVVNLGGSNNLTIGSIYAENTFMGPGAFGSTSSSYFSAPGLLYGIITNKSSVNIYNNHFQSFIQESTVSSQKKSAIKVIGVPDNTYYPNNYGPIVNVGSSNLNHKNDFIRTTIAIQSEDAVNLSIRNNNIDFENNQGAHNQNDYAIRLRNNKWPGDDIEILNNEITDVVNGILLSNCNEQLFVNITSNSINLIGTNGNTGIHTGGSYFRREDFFIKNNTIQNATKGIVITNSSQPTIEDNTINLNNNFSPSYGIRLINTSIFGVSADMVKKNTINTQSATSNINVYGISLESMGNIPAVECNTIKRTGTGLYFSNVVNNTFPTYDYIIFGNTMENNYNSFVLANGSELDDVGASIYPSDNEWINSANFDTYTDGANGSLTTLFTRGGGLPYEPMSNGNAPSFNPVNINISATGSLHNCDGGIIIGPGLMASSNNNSLPDFESKYNSDTAIWIAKYHYYRSLPEDSLISNKSIQAFKDSMDLSPVGALMQIKSSANSYSSRTSQMMAISCNTIQEVKLKTAISYQLQAKSLNWDTLPTAALNSLENIALECPFEAGPAVYEARNLLMRYTAKSYYNPCEGYTSTVAPAKSSKRIKFNDDEAEAEGSISIYPNPVKDELNINIQLQEDEVAEWTLQNIKGQLIQSGSLKSSNNPIDLSHLSEGVYFIQLKVNNQLIKTNKLIVQ